MKYFLMSFLSAGLAFAQLNIDPLVSTITYDLATDSVKNLPDVTLTNNTTQNLFWGLDSSCPQEVNNQNPNLPVGYCNVITSYPNVGYILRGTSATVQLRLDASVLRVGVYNINVVFSSSTNFYQFSSSTNATHTVRLTVTDSRTYTTTTLPVIPHIATGSGWKTTVTLVNPSSTTSLAEVKFYDNVGARSYFSVVGQGRLQSYLVAVHGFGTTTFVLDEGSNPTRTGSMEINTIYGDTIKAYASYNNNSFESIVTSDVPNTSTFTISFDNKNTNRTGVAIGNYLNFRQTVTLKFYNEEGVLFDTKTVDVPSYGQIALDLTTSFPLSAGKSGLVKISAPVNGLSGFGLKFNLQKNYFVTSPRF